MVKKLNFETKEKIVELAGTCFWYWAGFYSFLDSCGISTELQRKYPREAYNKFSMMRAILVDLDHTGNYEIINSIASGFYKLINPVDRENIDELKAKRLLAEFRVLLGNDPIDAEIKKRDQERAKDAYRKSITDKQTQKKLLEELNSKFLNLTTSNELTPQQRGFNLEHIFFDLLHLSEFEYTKPYRTSGREQIDGHFRYEMFDYLVEIKWTQEQTKQPDLSIFDGKIRGKAQSTRGFFLSANSFDSTAIQKFSGDTPRIVLMTGDDLALILNGRLLFTDVMKAKIDAIVRLGNICFPARKLAV